jgi:16S rRNA (cytosine967-C5)-methyltransferase
MDPGLLHLVAEIIQKSDRQTPADVVLRQTIKTDRSLDSEARTEVANAVFVFFRWFGWLKPGNAKVEQIEKALALAARFARDPDSFSDQELVRNAVPAWVNEELQVSPAWARVLQSPPKLWLRARSGQGRALAAKLGHCDMFGPQRLTDALEYFGREDLFRTPEFHAGEFELQDITSQAVGWVCDPKPGETWWDACAGEGGKTLHLSDLMQNRGLIWATDRVGWRLQNLKRRAGRAKVFNYRAAVWDGAAKLPTKTKFDGVLVDAPCSGIGTWHRNPHARWTTSIEDVRELGAVQSELLAHASGAVKPGGRLIYSVCTLSRCETLKVADAFDRQCPEFTRLLIANPLERQSAARHIQYRPQDFGGNGMFIAAWERKS